MPAMQKIAGGVFSSRNLLIAGAGLMLFSLLFLPSSPAQAGFFGFILGAAIWLKVISQHQMKHISARREHLPRVFQGDRLTVRLALKLTGHTPISLVQVEDRFLASLDVYSRHLLPVLRPGWTVTLKYRRRVERHRGLYISGPLTVTASDPLGVFFEQRRLDILTPLTVYPSASDLEKYDIPDQLPPLGPSMDMSAQPGPGEEIIGVREYLQGDSPALIHWRTSARRRQLYVIQRNRPVQAELAVFLDLTRTARYGLGSESTSELAVLAATSLLTRAYETRHRFSLGWSHRESQLLPAGAGLAHLHFLLDRLAVVSPAGETDFWNLVAGPVLDLRTGSRAVFIQVAALTYPSRVQPLIAPLVDQGIGVDIVLIDEYEFMSIYSDQEHPRVDIEARCQTLRQMGANVWPLRRPPREKKYDQNLEPVSLVRATPSLFGVSD